MDIEYDYYEEGIIFPQQEINKQTLCYKHKQSEAQALELTYSHLGRLIQSAEMLAYKLNLINNGYKLKYQTYDTFEIADKKDIDTLKYDVINFLDFYEKAIIIHNKKFKYELPNSIGLIIDDLKNWERKASKEDKRFFTTILDLIQKGSYDDSVFPDENLLYEKAKKDNSKFKKSAGFWKTFSIPILNFLNDLIKYTQENENKNPNYKPDIYFGLKPTNNKNLIDSKEYYYKELEINTKLDEINNILLFIIKGNVNSDLLIKAVKELNNLISSSKNSFGGIEMDKNKLSILKKNIENLKTKDHNTYNMLKEFTIEIDENNYQ